MKRAGAALLGPLLVLSACSRQAPKRAAIEKKTLRLAVIFTTAGKGGDLAQAVLGAANLAKEQASKLGVDLQIVQEDYAGQAKNIPARLADAQSKSDAILVGTNDDAVIPALRSVTDRPVLYPFLSDDTITKASNAFRFTPSNAIQAAVLTRFLIEHRKYSKIALLTDDSPLGKEGRSDLLTALSARGVRPALDTVFKPGKDIHTAVYHAGQLNVDALVVWSASESEAARIVVEVQHGGFGYQLALSGNLANATFAKNASAQVTPVAFRDGMLSVGPWAGPWYHLKRIIDFYTTFRSTNSAIAPVQAASAYDAALALAKAAVAHGTGSDELTSGLESLVDFAGAGVPLTFTPDNHEGVAEEDVAMYGYTKDQSASGGEFFPEVDTGGGFFTIVDSSVTLPKDLQFLAGGVASPEGSPSP